jgi:hypothetical protein
MQTAQERRRGLAGKPAQGLQDNIITPAQEQGQVSMRSTRAKLGEPHLLAWQPDAVERPHDMQGARALMALPGIR